MWRKFFCLTVGAFLILCSTTAAFNFVVDPYNIFQSERTIGFNFFTDVAQHHERLFKAIELINRKPSIIVLGNSKADFAIDPRLFGADSYNAAVRNMQPREMLAFAEAAVRLNPKLERIILNVDFEMFALEREEMPGFDPDQLRAARITIDNLFRTLLSADALESGLATVEFNNFFERDFLAFDPDGKFSEPALYELFTLENSFVHNSLDLKNLPPIDPIVFERKFDDFSALVELCREHNVELIVMILPVHRLHAECYPPREYALWQKKMTALTPVRDFSSIYIIDSTIDREKNFWDAAHIKASAFENYICPMLK